jgi:glycosyltransferase involved in cell wall biosynthesis
MNIVYVSQFRDCSGYAVAARGYLKAIDHYLSQNPGEFEFKIHTVPVENSDSKHLTAKEKALISKYEFSSEEEADHFCKKNYLVVWHMPAPMVYLIHKRSLDPLYRVALKLITNANRNINLTVWEADDIPEAWVKTYDNLKTDAIIVPCKWNQDTFSPRIGDRKCYLLPHVMDNAIVNPVAISGMENILNDKFVVYSMSQWNNRKGFDKLIQSFSMEFSGQDDTILVIKTYLNLMEDYIKQVPMAKQREIIASEIKNLKSSVYMHDGQPSKANIMLIADALPFEQISWLYQQADIFALLTRGEGFGLTVAESLLHQTPVLVPAATGYMDFTHQNSAFFVEGHWSPYISRPEYHCDMNWFEPHILSARKELRRAYEMWKQDSLKEKGMIGWEHVNSLNMDLETIGNNFVNIVKSEYNIEEDQEKPLTDIRVDRNNTKVSFLKRKINQAGSTREKLDLLKDSFKGEECYLITCGPSLKEYTPEFLKEKLKDKLVIAIKQGYDYVPEIVDFHLFNCNNFKLYEYKNNLPIVITTAGEPEEIISKNVWTTAQEYDIFMPIVNSNQDFNKALANTKEFDNYTLEKSVERPWGPGMIYEVALFLTEHLGVSDLYAIGWDHEKIGQTKSTRFYEEGEEEVKLVRKSDPMRPDEIERNIELSKDFSNWLSGKGVNVHICTEGSHVHKDVPRKLLEK